VMSGARAMPDVSLPIRPGMVTYEGDPAVRVERLASVAHGGVANVSHLAMSVHTGTHVDAPLHFLDGRPGVETIDPSITIGPAWVADLTGCVDDITVRDLEGANIPSGAERLLLHTRNSELWESDRFEPGYLGITAEAAELLVDWGVRLIGFDYLSVAPPGDPVPTHRTLLAAGVVILEGINLTGIAGGPYRLLCLPLLLDGCDGAPARAFLAEVPA
jgi:arylformamidase